MRNIRWIKELIRKHRAPNPALSGREGSDLLYSFVPSQRFILTVSYVLFNLSPLTLSLGIG